jgi:hypothetical protein
MTKPYDERRLEVAVAFGQGKNGAEGFKTYEMPKNLRIQAEVDVVGGASMGSCTIRIFGLELPIMNLMNTLGLNHQRERWNQVQLRAGDSDGMSTVFMGDIQEAWMEFNAAPDTCLIITSLGGKRAGLVPTKPTSYEGDVDVVTVMADLAEKADLNFQNWGVEGIKLRHPYFSGSARDQIIAVAQEAHIEHFIDGDGIRQTLNIWPKNGSRTDSIPVISPENGMRGYPAMAGDARVAVSCLFRPGISFRSKFKIKGSVIDGANRTWTAIGIRHDLASETPDGPWFTLIQGYSDQQEEPATPASANP